MPIVGPGGSGGSGVSRKEVEEIIAEKGGGPPSGKAGGSLTGEYPNPLIASAAISLAMFTTAAKEVGGSLTGSLPNPGLAASSVTATQIAANAIPTAALQNESITPEKLAAAVAALLFAAQSAETGEARLPSTEYEPSATRDCLVYLRATLKAETSAISVFVGGKLYTEWRDKPIAEGKQTFPFMVPRGQKWSVIVTGTITLNSIYQFLHA